MNAEDLKRLWKRETIRANEATVRYQNAEAERDKLRAELERQIAARIAVEEAFIEGRIPLGIPYKQIDEANARAPDPELAELIEAVKQRGPHATKRCAIFYGRDTVCDCGWQRLEDVLNAALLAAQSRQDAPDSSLALIRELRDALANEHDSRNIALGRHIIRPSECGACRLIARATVHLRECGADNSEVKI